MSITASCGNCGKTYQAPDRMAGKSVRCKQCGEIFRIDPPPDFEQPAVGGGGVDLDALERSFSDAEATSGGSMTAMKSAAGGPTLDAHGRPSIRREAGTEGMSLEGESDHPALRSNFRYRYPGARQIDRLLPWVLVVLTLFVIIQGSLSTEASIAGESITPRPPVAVALSRAGIMLALYIIIIWPASHLALSMAARKLRVSMPRLRHWRSFGGFSPVLMLGGGLFILSGGEPAALIMGTVVGIALAIGAVAILFRVFPNEVPIVGGYSAAGAAVGAGFSIALTVAVNLVAVSIAKTDASRTLAVSPIAVGMTWPPPTPIEVVKRPPPPRPSNASGPTVTPTPAPGEGGTTQPAGDSSLEALALPVPGAGETQMVKAFERTPVRPGFDTVIWPRVRSDAIGIVRTANGGEVETWNRSAWTRPTAQVGKNFDATKSPLIVSPTGRRVVRLVSDPVDRIEELPLGNTAVLAPTRVGSELGQGERSIIGLLDDGEAICSLKVNNGLALERYSIEQGVNTMASTMLKSAGMPISIEGTVAQTLRVTPDGRSVVVACREMHPEGPGDARILRYDLAKLERPTAACEVLLNRNSQITPLGFSLDATGNTAAMLLNAGGELNLTVWDVKPPEGGPPVGGVPLRSPKLDRKIGLLAALKPNGWDDRYDPIVWLDAHTLIIYGQALIDAQTGRSLGQTNVMGVVGQVPGTDEQGRVLLIQTRSEGRSLIRVTLDSGAMNLARQ